MGTPRAINSAQAESGILSGVDAKEVLHALRRRKWWILVSSLLVGAAVAAGTMRQPKVYQAVARIVIDPVLPKVLADTAEIDPTREQAARAEYIFNNTQYKIIKGRAVLRATIERLKLTEDDVFLRAAGLAGPQGEDLVKAVEGYLSSRVRVEPETHSRIVQLIIEDYDFNRAAKIVNALAQTYIDDSLERRLAATRSASKWLDERVGEFATKLEHAEKSLYEFKRQNMLVTLSLEDRMNMTATSLTALNEKLIGVRTKLIELDAERSVLTAQAEKAGGALEAVPRIAKNAVIGDIKRALADLERQRAELSTRYGERHPTMVGIENQMGQETELLKRELNLVLKTLDNEIEELKKSESSLFAAMEEEKKNALALNNLALDYSKLSRDFGTTKTTYEALLKRQTEADLSGLLESNFVRWLEPAEPQRGFVRPSVQKNALFGALIGLLLGVAIALGGVLLDNTVHTQADVEENLRLPFLGIFPSIQWEDDEKKRGDGERSPATRDLYILQNSKSSVAECARSLRTNVLFMGTETPLRRVLLTSAGPTEGKTTTAVALGITMAQAGNKVLLIDTDLRRPRLHRTFGVPGENGLTSVLVGTAVIDEVIKSTEVVGLDVLPCGPLPPNPAELLHTQKFAALLQALGEKYDRILLDSPPINAVTDAAILSQNVDGTILVVKASKTAKEAVRRASRQLLDVNANILGVVLNDVDFEEGGYYQHYYYYYNRYAYGADPKKGAKA